MPSDPDSTSRRPFIRILSLDGGGVRGLSSLLILRDLMERLAVKSGATSPIRPADYFELIIGTGTGGISALFLGRMRMTVDEAIDAYIKMAKTVFNPSLTVRTLLRCLGARRGQGHLLDGDVLKRAMSDIVRKGLGDGAVPLEDPGPHSMHCRTAVLAATKENADTDAYVFRSYPTARPASPFTICEVARATISTAELFAPVALGNPPVHFIDAGFAGFNNPSQVALNEAGVIWPGKKVNCLVSLGTGLQDGVSVGKTFAKVAKACMMIMQSCKQVHNHVFSTAKLAHIPYIRLNVDCGLAKISIMEWAQVGSGGTLAGVTDAYLRLPEVQDQLNLSVCLLTGEVPSPAKNSSNRIQGKFLPLLNPAPKIFHGRETYIKDAVAMLLQGKAAYIAILGSGGIGKTSIALTCLHNESLATKFGDHRLFVSCEGITSTALLVDAMCSAFGLHNLSSDCQKDLLLFLLDMYTVQPLLLIFDHFEMIWDAQGIQGQVENFLQVLGSVPMLSLVITMRGTVYPAGLLWTGCRLPIVQQLSPEAAYATFVDVCGNEISDRETVAELLDAVDHVPLAVTLMGHLGQTESPKQLLKRWTKEKTRFLKRGDQDRLNSVDVSIALSIESHSMTSIPEALQLLTVIALLPAGAFEGELAEICPHISDVEGAATTLRRVALAYYDGVQSLRVLSPIRSYIMNHYPPKTEDLKDLTSFHFELAAQSCNGDRAMISNAAPNIEAVLTEALLADFYDDLAVQAALDWSQFLYLTTPRVTNIKLAILMAQKANRQSRLAECLQGLGEMQKKLGNHEEAQATLAKAQAEFKASGEQLGAAQCLLSLGAIQQMLTNYKEAQKTLSEALAEFKAIGVQHGVAECLQRLGNIQRMLSNHKEAQTMLAEALAEFKAVGQQKGVAQCLRSLGNIQLMHGNYEHAQAVLSEAHAEFKAVGEQLGAAQCLRSLGNIQLVFSNYEQAQIILEESYAEFTAVGQQKGAAQCLRSLGNIQLMLGNYEQAQTILTEALAEFKVVGQQKGVAQCLHSLGDIQLILGNYEQAQKVLAEAQAEFRVTADRLGAVQCLHSLGGVQHRLGNYNVAHAMYRETQIKFKLINSKLGTLDCLHRLGGIQRMLKDYPTAYQMLKEAHAGFDSLGNQFQAVCCLQSQAYLLQDDGKLDEAKALFAQAKSKFEDLVPGMKEDEEKCTKALAAWAW